MKSPAFCLVSVASVVALCAVACGGASDDLPPIDFSEGAEPAPKASASTSGNVDGGSSTVPAADTCPYSGKPIDVSTMKTCLDGGRCVPGAAIPTAERARLAECAGGYCVPEKIISNKGLYLPKSCKSLIDGEGRCTSLVFPDLAKQKDALPQDVCDANERCAPCFDPLSGKETGACRSIACDAPKTTAKTFAPCCAKKGAPRGRCVEKSTMPPEGAKGLGQHECSDAAVCVPNELIENAPPITCRASSVTGILLGPYDGVCMSDCIPRDFLGQIGTARGNCQDGFFCAPCKNPLNGKATGAPGCPP